MSEEPAFWDSSALVPRCVQQVSSRFLRLQSRRYGTVVWWGTTIEMQSAIVRLYRNKEIRLQEREWAEARLDALRAGWKEILPTEEVRDTAVRLLRKHWLRAGDSLQLAAALVWCGGRASKRIFICSDERLSKAAAAEGFSVVTLPES